MLIITFHNDSTGDEIEGNYDYSVYINREKISEGRIENHNRLSGWEGLVSLLAKKVYKGE
jgi:hypothetical protein